jgi:hypothetical protein
MVLRRVCFFRCGARRCDHYAPSEHGAPAGLFFQRLKIRLSTFQRANVDA